MLFNYLKIALRNLRKHKAFSVINVSGLAIGMTCSIFILLWVREERSFDRFNSNADRLFRLTDNVGDFKAAVTPAGVAAGLKSQLPAIKNITRISKNHSAVFEVGTQKFQEKRLIYADSNFLEMFNYPLLKGNKNICSSKSRWNFDYRKYGPEIFWPTGSNGKTYSNK